ncbi:MAG: hypothetical protein K2L28_04565 [Muribaculaceae bacterium]|nr:hypothetical protein [Muribaculaceae bacterium]
MWRVWSQMRSFQRFVNDPEGEMRRAANRHRGARSAAARPQPRRRGKKIPRDVGEYVQYTEIEVSESERSRSAENTSSTRTVKEEQVTDIKWVDL